MFDLLDTQTESLITSSAVNRWCAFRIDIQAYLITSIYALYALLSNSGKQSDVAMMAVGLQLAVEISRHLNMAVRWTATFESDMVNV
jgi:hypothetical protein